MIRLRYTFVLSVLLATTSLFGCEENLAPREHFDRPFTLYGVLSPDLDTQSVRIYAIEDFPTLGSPTIDATVTSKDLTTGETRTWKDSAVVDPNGQYGHVFWSPFRAEYGHIYHVNINRPSDGAVSYADVRVPPRAIVRLANVDDSHLEVLIEGEGIRALSPEAEYLVNGRNNPDSLIHSYTISYEGKERQIDQGWRVTIDMAIDRYWVQRWYTYEIGAQDESSAIACPILALHKLDLHVLVGDTLWNPPRGVFNPKLLSQPGVLSNLHNGFGFIGGGYRIDQRLRPTRRAVEQACFVYHQPEL